MCVAVTTGTYGTVFQPVDPIRGQPRGVSVDVARRLAVALNRRSKREVGRLVEETLTDFPA